MTTANSILITTTLLQLFCQGNAVFTSVIPTDKGLVRGEILTTLENSLQYASFKGIPYAMPPIQNLRFKPPVEKDPWQGILDAVSEGSMCMQFNSSSSTTVGSEDCLYLNVYTPHAYFSKMISKPVMVWIHGGAYAAGNSNASYYGPDFLLEEDVIVVTFNYRLGAFGFLNVNHENASGNYGLKDQNLALKWVQKNIANFGGNPEQVTIFGQSTGAVSVDLHVLSNMSTGLFKQSISMSGSPLCLYWGFQTMADAEEQAFILGSKLGTNTRDKDELLNTLLRAPAIDIINKSYDPVLIFFRPTIESTTIAPKEEKFLTECTLTKYVSGNYNKGPHIMGFTSDETLTFAQNISNLVDSIEEILTYIDLGSMLIENPLLYEIVSVQTARVSNLTSAVARRLIRETSDLFFGTGIDSKQKILRLHNSNPIYYYRFSFDSVFSAHRKDGVTLNGVGHGDELPYLFYRPDIDLPLDQPDIQLTRRRLVRMWANFAKYGNPTPNGDRDHLLRIIWPDSGYSGRHLEFNRNLHIGFRPTNNIVKTYQLAGLGTSPILNDCIANAARRFVQ